MLFMTLIFVVAGTGVWGGWLVSRLEKKQFLSFVTYCASVVLAFQAACALWCIMYATTFIASEDYRLHPVFALAWLWLAFRAAQYLDAASLVRKQPVNG